MGGKSYTLVMDDDPADAPSAPSKSYEFVPDDEGSTHEAPTLSAETHERAALTDKSGGNIPPSLEGIAPVEAKDDAPSWMKALVDRGEAYDKAKLLAAQNSGPMLGGMIYGASAHALDPMKDERMNAPADVRKAAEMMGTVASPMNLVGGAVGARAGAAVTPWIRGLTSGVVGGAASGGLTGGVQELADNHDASTSDVLSSAAHGAGWGSLVGGLTGAAGDLADATSRGARAAGDWFRQRALGLGKDELGAFSQRAAADAAAEAQAAGLSPREVADAASEASNSGNARRAMIDQAERIVPPNLLFPRGPSGIEGQYSKAANALEFDNIRPTIAAAKAGGAQLSPNPNLDARIGLRDEALAARDAGYDAFQIPELQRASGQVAQSAPITTPEQLRAAKIGWDKRAFKGGPGSPEEAAGLANLATANQYRGQLYDYIDQGAPQLSDGFRQANQDYGLAATIRDAANTRGAGPVASSSPTTNVGTAAMNVLGGAGFAPDGAANMARLAQGATGGLGAAASGASQTAPAAAAALARAGRGQSDAYVQERQNDNSQGHLLPTKLERLVRDNPQAFGEHAKEFVDAAGDPDKLTAVYDRYARGTDVQYARQLNALVNGGAQ